MFGKLTIICVWPKRGCNLEETTYVITSSRNPVEVNDMAAYEAFTNVTKLLFPPIAVHPFSACCTYCFVLYPSAFIRFATTLAIWVM